MFTNLVLELLEIISAYFRNTEIIQSCLVPATELVTAFRTNIYIDFSACRRPDEQIDDLFPTLVNNRCHRPIFQNIDSTADQRVARLIKFDHRRRVIQFTVEPWPNDLQIVGATIDQMRNHERTGVV